MSHTVARKRKSQKSKAYRFDARLNEEQKFLLQKAADLEGPNDDGFRIAQC